MNVSVLCFVLPPANGSIRLGKAEVRQDRLRVGDIGSTFTNISALWRNLFVKRYDNIKIIFKLHIAFVFFVWYSMNIPTKEATPPKEQEAYQHERQRIAQADR